MKCLETREVTKGVKRRRYQREDGTRFTTIEVPISVIKALGKSNLDVAVARWERGEKMRAQTAARRARAYELLSQRVKPTAIAHELGITDQRVRQFRQELSAMGSRNL